MNKYSKEYMDELLSFEEKHDIPDELEEDACAFCGTNLARTKCPLCKEFFCNSCGGLKTTCYYCGEEYCPDCWESNHYYDACCRECYMESTGDSG